MQIVDNNQIRYNDIGLCQYPKDHRLYFAIDALCPCETIWLQKHLGKDWQRIYNQAVEEQKRLGI